MTVLVFLGALMAPQPGRLQRTRPAGELGEHLSPRHLSWQYSGFEGWWNLLLQGRQMCDVRERQVTAL